LELHLGVSNRLVAECKGTVNELEADRVEERCKDNEGKFKIVLTSYF
jgi:hypothetical protein